MAEPGPGKAARTGRGRLASASLTLAFSAVVLVTVWKAAGLSPDKLAAAFSSADFRLLALTLALSVLWHVFFGADKLWRVLKALGIEVSFRRVLFWRLGSGPLRAVLPVDAGEIFDVVFLWREKNTQVSAAAGAVAFESGLNLIGASFWLAVGLVLSGAPSAFSGGAAVGFLGLFFALFFFATPVHAALVHLAEKLSGRLGRFAAGVLGPFARASAGRKLFFAAYGIVFQIRPLLVCWLLFRAFGYSPDPAGLITAASLAFFAGHAPSASGLGPREAAVMVFFAGYAPPAVLFSVGFSLTLFVHIIPMLAGAPWALWFLGRLWGGKKTP